MAFQGAAQVRYLRRIVAEWISLRVRLDLDRRIGQRIVLRAECGFDVQLLGRLRELHDHEGVAS